MKVGDLVKWEHSCGKYELGIIIDLDGDGEEHNGVMVYFLEDGYTSCITKEDLEAIS